MTAMRTAPPAPAPASMATSWHGLDLGDSFTDVPGGTANWTFTGVTATTTTTSGSVDDRHRPGRRRLLLDQRLRRSPMTAIAHGATGDCLGVDGEASGRARPRRTASPTSPAAPPTGRSPTAPATTTTHRLRSPSSSTRPTRDCTRSAATTVTYDGIPRRHRRRARRRWRGPGRLDLGDSFTDVPGGTADWTFTDVTGNYNDTEGSVASSSTRPTRDCTGQRLRPSPTTAIRTAPPATASASTARSWPGSTSGTASPTSPVARADWTFTDVPATTTTPRVRSTIVIDQADALRSVTGYDGHLRRRSHGATGDCLGVDGEVLAGLDLGADASPTSRGHRRLDVHRRHRQLQRHRRRRR